MPAIMSVKNIRKKTGLPPGSLIYTGEKPKEKVVITLVQFNHETIDYAEKQDFNKITDLVNPGLVNWININSLHNKDLIEKIGQTFDIHPLILEDILNIEHLPKAEEFENHLFFTLKMVSKINGSHDYEQISLILGKNYVISFQEKTGDVFDSLRDRISQSLGRIRSSGNDYLFYALIDTIVDNYFPMLGDLEDEINLLEEQIINDPNKIIAPSILEIKKKLIHMRKFAFPLRDEILRIIRADIGLINKKTQPYFQDIHEHLMSLTDIIDGFRETLAVLMEVSVASNANRLNQIMKTLTIIATIFMPLTFIGSIYGMNFKFMPELEWKYSYPIVLFVMLLLGGGMVYWMKKNKWF